MKGPPDDGYVIPKHGGDAMF